MSLVKLRDFVPATDGTFIAPIATLEQLDATRALLTTDDGTCQGYAHADGRLWAGPLVTRTPAKIAADAATATAAAADQAKVTAATNTVIANVTRVRNNGAGSGTDANRDNWLMALSYLLFRQE